MVGIIGVKNVSSDGDEFVDNLHDIFGVVSILAIGDVDIMAKKKIKLIALSVIDLVNLGLQPLAYTISTVLGIFVADFGENSITLIVDKIHQIIPMLQRNYIIFFEKFFNVEEDILGREALGFFLIESLTFHMIYCD